MEKSNITIQELVSQIDRGEIRLPEIQRGYVWSGAKVRDLLDSLYRGYPSGTILTWKTSEELPTREMAITTRERPASKEEKSEQAFQLLLDGQQRLTSLSAVISGEPVKVSGNEKKIDILFNLKHPDEPSYKNYANKNDNIDASKEEKKKEKQAKTENMVFAIKNTQLEQMPHWISVTEVFKASDVTKFLKAAGLRDFDDPRYNKYIKRLNKLRDIKKRTYDVHMLEREKTYQEVTQIFFRVNSLGTKLTGSDLALAQITAKWKGSLNIFEAFQDKCKKEGFDINLGIIVRNLISFATGSSNSKNLANLEQKGLKKAWKDSTDGFSHAIDFLKNNLSIDSPILLSSPYILIALAYFFNKNGNKLSFKDEKKLRYWVLIANAKGHYSRGAIYTFLDQDLKDIEDGKGLDTMIESLQKHFGLHIEATDLENKNSRNAYFKIMFLAFQNNEAKDWETRVAISFNNSGISNKLEFHHIFPQSKLKNKYTGKEINDICNLAFIGGKTNREISNKLPSDYLPKINKDVLTSQQVPTDANLWEMDKYDEFLAERREMVVVRLNEFLDHESIK